jgi:tetratricopeptide (TPR) repeat protein
MIELLLQAERAMSVGLIDRAEVLYAQVAEADPRNSIAVVGLARVRLERGDEAGALELARRALAIDPENAAAERMVERLEEVLAYRRAEAAAAPVVQTTPEVEHVALAAPIDATPEITSAPPLPPAPAPTPKRRSWLDLLFCRL